MLKQLAMLLQIYHIYLPCFLGISSSFITGRKEINKNPNPLARFLTQKTTKLQKRKTKYGHANLGHHHKSESNPSSHPAGLAKRSSQVSSLSLVHEQKSAKIDQPLFVALIKPLRLEQKYVD